LGFVELAITTPYTHAATPDPRPAGGRHRMTEKAKGPASYFPSIEEKYGRPINEWQALIRSASMTTHAELVRWLKTEYGLGHGHANALVAHTLAEDRGRAD
jgi:hypothetical protein